MSYSEGEKESLIKYLGSPPFYDSLEEYEEMPKEPLTKEEFQDWVENHYQHLVKDVCKIRGQMLVLIPLSIAILSGIIALCIALLR